MTHPNPTLAVFGLGYVGAVSAGCFAKLGFPVIGVDVDPGKVEALAAGRAPLLETGLAELLAEQHAAGRIRATPDAAAAVAESDLAIVCVGTPSQPNGSLDLTFVERVCRQIGAALRPRVGTGRPFVVVIRSTVLPGVVGETLVPLLEQASGGRAGIDYGVVQNPEFLREGSAIDDFFHPPKTVVGASDERSAEAVARLYSSIAAPLVLTDLATASVVKYADNAFHALKVSFANEIGRLCKRLGVDSHAVMDIFCQDRKLNISPYYLRPGFAFGGSCLPKDVRALLYRARSLDVDVPLLASVLPSNRVQIDALVSELLPFRQEGIGVLGLSFKPGTDDLRESPLVTVVETLIGRGAAVQIHDPGLRLSALVGSNLRYITKEIPHVAKLLRESPEEVVRESRAIVVGHNTPAFAAAVAAAAAQQHVFDLVRLPNALQLAAQVHGVAW